MTGREGVLTPELISLNIGDIASEDVSIMFFLQIINNGR